MEMTGERNKGQNGRTEEESEDGVNYLEHKGWRHWGMRDADGGGTG